MIRIYSDMACNMLECLGKEADDPQFATQSSIIALLGVSKDAYQRAKGSRPGSGWKKPNPADTSTYRDAIKRALEEIAFCYTGPRRFMNVARTALREGTDRIPGIELPSDLDTAMDSLSANAWQPKVEWADQEDWPAFCHACDLIVGACCRERSDTIAAGAESAVAPNARVSAATTHACQAALAQAPAYSLAALAFAVIHDAPCSAGNGAGVNLDWQPDNSGPIDIGLPETPERLLQAIMPAPLLEAVASSADCRIEAAAGALLDARMASTVAPIVCDYFSHDGGFRFSQLVEACMRLMSAECNAPLLMKRCARLYEQLGQADATHGGDLCESLSAIQYLTRSEAPRVLAALTLSLLAGPHRHRTLVTMIGRR